MKRIFLCLPMILLCYFSYSQPIPSEVKSTVAFIYVLDQTGKPIPNGTGFFVGVRDTSKMDLFGAYLVTAKHVLQLDDRRTFLKTVFIRVNKLIGDAEFLRLDLYPSGKQKNIFIHPDTTVDIAVIPGIPDQSKYEFKFLPDEYLTTENDIKNLGIREGSEVFFTGLFAPFVGEHKNYPVVRFGRVALVTNEKVDWDGMKSELYLMESSSYGGNSGSPVFFYLGAEREPGSLVLGSPVLKLAGIMKGFFGEPRPIQLIETSRVPIYVSNVGIAAVTPAHLLSEILFGTELKSIRGF